MTVLKPIHLTFFLNMSTIPILNYPDPRLRTKARQVESVHAPDIQKIIHDMLETLAQTENCAALAATQLDLINPPSITVINIPNPNFEKNALCLINPKIIETSGECTDVEGCMSIFPSNIHGKVKRAQKIKVQALNVNGEEIEFETEDFLARCLQHEIDHLHGIIYLDHLSPLKKKFVEKKIAHLNRIMNEEL